MVYSRGAPVGSEATRLNDVASGAAPAAVDAVKSSVNPVLLMDTGMGIAVHLCAWPKESLYSTLAASVDGPFGRARESSDVLQVPSADEAYDVAH